MKISQYIKEYTSGESVGFKYVVGEVQELIAEVVKANKDGIKEEFGDVFHFLQLWLYWRYAVDGEVWRVTKSSVKKFMDRKAVWNKIYVAVGLSENISGYVGNYKRLEKVISHLERFGINRETAKVAYERIVIE